MNKWGAVGCHRWNQNMNGLLHPKWNSCKLEEFEVTSCSFQIEKGYMFPNSLSLTCPKYVPNQLENSMACRSYLNIRLCIPFHWRRMSVIASLNNTTVIQLFVLQIFLLTRKIEDPHYWPFVRVIYWWLVDSPQKMPVMHKSLPDHNAIMWSGAYDNSPAVSHSVWNCPSCQCWLNGDVLMVWRQESVQ